MNPLKRLGIALWRTLLDQGDLIATQILLPPIAGAISTRVRIAAKDGKKGHSTEVIVDDIQFVPNGSGNGASGGAGNGKAAAPNGGGNRETAISADIDDDSCPF